MVTIIIYLHDQTYIEETLTDIINKTPPELLDEIIICNEGNLYKSEKATIIQTNGIGRARAWSLAVERSKSDILVFVHHTTKVTTDWLPPLLELVNSNQSLIVSPAVHVLEPMVWSLTDKYWRRFGFRWDLQLYNREQYDRRDSAVVSNYCFCITKSRLFELGGFDCGIPTNVDHAEAIELSLCNWLCGGSVVVDDRSVIGIDLEVGQSNIAGLARIVETWLPEYATYFYDRHNKIPHELPIGKLTDRHRKQTISTEQFLSEQLPELLAVYRLRKTAVGRNVGVVCSGPSIDAVLPAYISRNDIIIGVDYVGLLYKCDYVVATNVETVVQLRSRYRDEQFILPILLENKMSGTYVPAREVAPGCVPVEVQSGSCKITSVYPPFCVFDDATHVAVHFALFLQPDTVVVFGCDGKIIDGYSHSAKIEYYDGGKLWANSDATRKRLALREFGLDQLSRLALTQGVKLLRMNYL